MLGWPAVEIIMAAVASRASTETCMPAFGDGGPKAWQMRWEWDRFITRGTHLRFMCSDDAYISLLSFRYIVLLK